MPRSLFRLCTIPEFPNSDSSETIDEHFNGRIIEINCGWPPFVSRLFVAGSPISWLRIFPCRLVDRVFPRREHQPVWMSALYQLLLCIPRVYMCRGLSFHLFINCILCEFVLFLMCSLKYAPFYICEGKKGTILFIIRMIVSHF